MISSPNCRAIDGLIHIRPRRDYGHGTREGPQDQKEAVGREKWVINKIRALCSWYTKGFEGGAQFRIGVNAAKSIAELEDILNERLQEVRTRRGRAS